MVSGLRDFLTRSHSLILEVALQKGLLIWDRGPDINPTD